MKRILALLLAVTCTMGTLCACGGATSGSGSAANDETSSFTNDDHDNSITVGIAQDLDESLDPYTITAAGTREVLFNIYEGLVKADSTGNFNPAVAKDYKLSDDKLTYTFTLRDGVYWYDPDGSVTTIEAAGDTCEALLYGLPAGKYQLEETVVPEHFFPAPPVAVEITLETTSETPKEVVVTNTPRVKLGIDADKFNVVIAMALTLIIGSGVGIVALVRHRRKR